MSTEYWFNDLGLPIGIVHFLQEREWLDALWDERPDRMPPSMTFFAGKALIIRLSQMQDIERFFARLGLEEILNEHLTEVASIAPTPEQERVLREREWCFNLVRGGMCPVPNDEKRRTVFMVVWFSKFLPDVPGNPPPLTATLVAGISPPGMEGLVKAKMEEIFRELDQGRTELNGRELWNGIGSS